MATKRINSVSSGGIYLILCSKSDKIYVGSSKDFEYRWQQHLLKLEHNAHHNKNLQHAYNKYGKDSFEFAPIIELGEYDRQFYFETENKVIDEMLQEGVKLFNFARAGGGWSKSIEHLDPQKYKQICQNISNGCRKFLASTTAEERALLYGNSRNVPLSEERKLALSNFWSGKPKSEETRRKMSQSQKTKAKNDGRAERLAEIGKLNKGKLPPNSKKITIGGVEFGSMKSAANELGVNYFSLLSAAKPEKYKKYERYMTLRDREILSQHFELEGKYHGNEN